MLNGEGIERVQYTKFLGVYIDDHLNWNQHIREVCLKLSRTCGILYKVRRHLTLDALMSIYYTLAYPYIHYCISVWGCTWPSFLNKLVVTQKKIFRCIFSLKKIDSTSDIFITYNLLNVHSIHKYFLLLLLFRTHNLESEIFTFSESLRPRRGNSLNLRCPRFNTTLYKNSIVCQGPTVWNELPIHLKNFIISSHLMSFKRKIKTHLLTVQNQREM